MDAGRVVAAKGLAVEKINCVLPVNSRQIWIGTDKGVVRWTGTEISNLGIPASLGHIQIHAMMLDRDSNVWLGSSGGLLRFNSNGVSHDQNRSHFNSPVTALFEDREGNVWTGGPEGVERLRDSPFVSYSVADGLPSDSNGPVYVDPVGRTWFAPLEGGLYWLVGGKVKKITDAGLTRDVVYSISGRESELWVGRQHGGLNLLRHHGGSFTAKTYTHVDGLAQDSVYAVHQSRDGTVWAGTLSGGVSEFRNGHFTTYTTESGMASNTVTSIAESPDGTMWFATPNGLNAFSNGRWRILTAREGSSLQGVNCLLEDAAGVLWIGSATGLSFLDSGRVLVPRDLPQSLHEQILGIAEDGRGWLWIATSNRVLRVKRDRLLAGGFKDADMREFGLADGLHGTEGVKRDQSVYADQLERIWFSMNRGLSVVDPGRVGAMSTPTLVHIEALSADGSQVDLRGSLHISASRQRITFSYTGLSLSSPEHVQYRYRLDNFDRDWSEPIAARTAIYTNLRPGPYRFRVIASNGDGLWNGLEATFPFEVEPMWWQTWWFRLSGALIASLAILAVYRLRMHQLTQQLNVRFEERLAERTRIAQDLHDTLLQGFISASMQLGVANGQLPADWPAKSIVNDALELMRHVIDEGRNAVRGMRLSSGNSDDLEVAFSRIPQELVVQQATAFKIIVEGQVRPMHPLARDEVYRIGREALVNAFRHSQATSVEVELEYATREFRVLVRDNGCGIDPEVLRLGRDGHWGLSGMSERAHRIGAALKVWSHAGGGTEIELRVPGRVAFQSRPSRRRLAWITRLGSQK